MITDDLRFRVAELLLHVPTHQPTVCLRELKRADSGWETDVYLLDYDAGPARPRSRHSAALRVFPNPEAGPRAEREAAVLEGLSRAGYPVPRLLGWGGAEPPLGLPFVLMERVDGSSMRVAIDSAEDEDRGALVTLFCRLLFDLHRLPWERFCPQCAEVPQDGILSELETSRASLKRLPSGPGEEVLRVLSWFEAHARDVKPGGLSATHGDYHPDNILLTSAGEPRVIDWSNFAVKDPRFDLGWTILLVSSYGHPEAREIVLREYQRLSGEQVEDIEYFEAFGAARRLFGVLLSLRHGPEALGMHSLAREGMLAYPNHLRAVYGRLSDVTGVRVLEAEDLLSSLG
ncbi:MAG TPA: phosphotransferase [Armatimonadota bacterium]|jgi:aminoglycoside phosphotransferase (APT) family kinase protein